MFGFQTARLCGACEDFDCTRRRAFSKNESDAGRLCNEFSLETQGSMSIAYADLSVVAACSIIWHDCISLTTTLYILTHNSLSLMMTGAYSVQYDSLRHSLYDSQPWHIVVPDSCMCCACRPRPIPLGARRAAIMRCNVGMHAQPAAVNAAKPPWLWMHRTKMLLPCLTGCPGGMSDAGQTAGLCWCAGTPARRPAIPGRSPAPTAPRSAGSDACMAHAASHAVRWGPLLCMLNAADIFYASGKVVFHRKASGHAHEHA